MAFSQNAGLEAALVHAAWKGGKDRFMFTAMHLGLQPDEAVHRSDWLKTQPDWYVSEVVALVREMDDGSG